MLYCFLDTNIFIQCQEIRDIDWKAELGASEICLVIAPVVFEELDVFKDNHKNRRKRDRARRSIELVESILDSPHRLVRDGVFLDIAPDLYRMEFGAYNLSPEYNDDRLVASAIGWSHQHSDDDLILVSHDSGPRMKARQRELQVKKLSEKYRLPDQLDPRDKEIRELKSKLAQIENAQPKLQLGFRDSMGKLVNFLHASNDFSQALISDAELNAIIETKQGELQYVRQEQSIESDRLSSLAVFASLSKFVTNSQIDEYYRQLEVYLEGYRDYLLDESLASIFPHRSIEVHLVLQNAGSTPAQNVEVRLDVQGCSEILLQVPEVPPYEPSPPAKPEPRLPFDFGPYDRSILPYLGYGIHNNDIDLGPPWEEWTRETDSSGTAWFEYKIAKLPHHRNCDIEEIYLMFYKDNDFPETVTIDYEVTADNMVDMLAGSLTVIVNKDTP